jgi:hypothetical protein
MSLLHRESDKTARFGLWELGTLAQSLGLPQMPAFKLPELPPLIGGCDWTKITAVLGATAANALHAQLSDPTIQGLLTNGLTQQKTQLLGYIDTLDRQKTDLLAQLVTATGVQGALGNAQTLLGGVGAGLEAGPLNAVGEACPAVGGLLAYAHSALGQAGTELSSAGALIGGLQAKIEGLTSLRIGTESVLSELDAHLAIIPSLLTTALAPP